MKPDQLIKRRGKLGLIELNVDVEGVKKWVTDKAQKDITIGNATGPLKNFIVEPFVPHKQVILLWRYAVYESRQCEDRS